MKRHLGSAQRSKKRGLSEAETQVDLNLACLLTKSPYLRSQMHLGIKNRDNCCDQSQ